MNSRCIGSVLLVGKYLEKLANKYVNKASKYVYFLTVTLLKNHKMLETKDLYI